MSERNFTEKLMFVEGNHVGHWVDQSKFALARLAFHHSDLVHHVKCLVTGLGDLAKHQPEKIGPVFRPIYNVTMKHLHEAYNKLSTLVSIEDGVERACCGENAPRVQPTLWLRALAANIDNFLA